MITARRLAKAAGKHTSLIALKLRRAMGAGRRRHCPACGNDVVGFFRYGETAEWGCPDCGSSPRERLINALLDCGRLTIPDHATILHMAPNEMSLVRRFSDAASCYRPADFSPERYTATDTERMDLMALDEKATIDILYASHVMEHVPDDARVLANIAHALKPGGEAWLLVPLHDAPTEDGDSDLSPAERERRFGQWDHVRQYGPDFARRIEDAGLIVDTLDASLFPEETRSRAALDDTVFRCRKSNGG